MPKRRQKRDDTSESDEYEDEFEKPRKVHFGSVQLNRFLPPDLLEGQDATKYSILAWSNVLYAQKLLPWNQRKQLFERALKFLPYSYKIWHMYLKEYIDFCRTRSIYSKQYKSLNELFQRALQKLPKMPRIWIMYTQVLEKQHMLSKIRAVFNWSFRNLPLTQHQKIWKRFSLWSMKLDNSNTALTVIPRYIKLNPDFKEQFADYLLERKMYNKAVEVILQILKDDGYHSKAGKSKKDFQFDIMEIVTQHPDKVEAVKGEELIRQCITKYPDDQGRLWVKLSQYFTRKGQFQSAREVFQEALEKIDNIKDFGVIFNAYTKFEEQMITALGNEEIQEYAAVGPNDNVDYEIEQRLKKLQTLIERQPFMLSKINVKRAPNDVKAWLAYAELYENKNEIQECLNIIDQAIKSIDPQHVQTGMLSSLWIKLSQIYQSLGQLRQCNQILNQATTVNYKMVQDYFSVWIRWVQMLLEQNYYEDALRVVKHVLFRRKNQPSQQLKIKNIDDLLRSNISLWQLYIDIEISIGNFETIKTAYQRCKQHKALTPIMLLNLTNFLWQNAYFEEVFRVFEFAINSFKWPSLYEIWISYIHKFISRYGDDPIGIERTRSIFQRLLKTCPIQHTAIFHYLYAKFEQEHGMISYAINIYDNMVNKVPKQQRAQAYCIYICKVAKILGITKTRAIFQSALQKLSEKQVLKIGRQYAKLQANLGEIDRARAVFVYISQFTDPRDDMDGLWQEWQTFQVQHGDKDTYKEYLRVKRSVQAKYQMLPPDLQKIEAKVKQGLI